MLGKIFDFITAHPAAVCLAIILFAALNAGVLFTLYSAPAATPTPAPTVMPTPTATPEPTAVPTAEPTVEPTPVPTPVPSPTVTPDLNITRSISTLDQYAPNYMVQVDKSAKSGLLSVDLLKSDMGGQYAYINDTYVTSLTIANTWNQSVDRVRIKASCVNWTDNSRSIYEDEHVDHVLLNVSDKITRTAGFKVAPGTPPGKYLVRFDVYVDIYGNDTWAGYGCGFESGLNILAPPA